MAQLGGPGKGRPVQREEYARRGLLSSTAAAITIGTTVLRPVVFFANPAAPTVGHIDNNNEVTYGS
jgi:hypothetical protein